ncbi:MAG TPA: hypothetical protein VLB01_05775 [Thermodesulfobacteriota bacterium]|nr:hypothetical protein [Thermodesulfobacteriota bacterium]
MGKRKPVSLNVKVKVKKASLGGLSTVTTWYLKSASMLLGKGVINYKWSWLPTPGRRRRRR